jgi:hypothetical protein
MGQARLQRAVQLPCTLIVQHEQMSQGGLATTANEAGPGAASKTCVDLTGEG